MQEQGQGTAPETGSDTERRGLGVGMVVLIAVVCAALAGGVVFLWQQAQVGGTEDDAAALRTQVQQLQEQLAAEQVSHKQLQSQVRELQAQLRGIEGQDEAPSPDPTAETATDLEDGRYLTTVVAANDDADPQTLTVDVLQWFTGDAANKAAKQDGAETPVPNDYYIRNESEKLRTLDVADTAGTEVLYWHRKMIQDGKPISFATFAEIMRGSASWQRINQDGLYWITIDGGLVTDISVQFVP